MKKRLLLLLVVVVAAVASVPLWGGCDLNERFCTATCNLRHLGSDAKLAGCKTRCAADAAGCHAEEGVESVRQFMEGLQNR